MNYVPLLVFTKIGHHDSCTVLYSILYYTKLYKIIHKNETAGSKEQKKVDRLESNMKQHQGK